ncbi:MAG: uroporphyrinogen-III synthase [Arachnia sp.]
MRGAAEICDISAARESRLEEFHPDPTEGTQKDRPTDVQQSAAAGKDLWPRGHELRDARVFLPREEGPLSAAIEAAGPHVVCEPLITRRTLEPRGNLSGADWVAVTSARTVWTLEELGWRIPEAARIAAVGPATAQALKDAGYAVDLIPEGPSSAADLLRVWPAGSGRVVVPGSDLSSTELVDGLLAKGYDAEALPIYTVDAVSSPSPHLASEWRNGDIDAVIVTSGSVARAIDGLLGWPSGIRVLAFGHPTAAALADLDVAASVSPGQDPASVVRALTDLLTKGQA